MYTGGLAWGNQGNWFDRRRVVRNPPSPHTAVDRSPWVGHNCLKSTGVDLRRDRVRFGQDCTLGLGFVFVWEE